MNKNRYHILLLSLFICTVSMVSAQKDIAQESTGFKHTIGLNTTGLLNQFLDDTDKKDYKTPYLITYSIELGKLALRAGLGPEYTSETIVHDGFTDTEENTFLRLDGRIGAGFVVLEDHRWQAMAGIDIAGGYERDRSISDSGFDRITEQLELETIGGGPFLQLAYHVSKRISLSVESSVYWMYEKTTRTELFENFPDFNNVVSENTGSSLHVALPNTLFVRIHF